jgi:hypothetical protein
MTLEAMLDVDGEAMFQYADRSGPFGYLRPLIELVNRRPVSIVPTKYDTASYDLVIVGTPVWARSVSSPIRAYLAANASRLPLVAVFWSYRSPGARRAKAGEAVDMQVGLHDFFQNQAGRSPPRGGTSA